MNNCFCVRMKKLTMFLANKSVTRGKSGIFIQKFGNFGKMLPIFPCQKLSPLQGGGKDMPLWRCETKNSYCFPCV
jgi:hypothetical protein